MKGGFDVLNHLLPAALKLAQKRMLNILADWPWITSEDLGGLLGVSRARTSQLTMPLISTRLARRDSTSAGGMRYQWNVEPKGADAPVTSRNASGRWSTLLALNLEHLEAVVEFVSRFAWPARARGYGSVQFDPPRRASQHFRQHYKLLSIHHGTFSIPRRRGKTWGSP